MGRISILENSVEFYNKLNDLACDLLCEGENKLPLSFFDNPESIFHVVRTNKVITVKDDLNDFERLCWERVLELSPTAISFSINVLGYDTTMVHTTVSGSETIHFGIKWSITTYGY